MLRRNSGIKSLFPHPNTLVRESDGKLKIVRSWDDIRVNYKQGGTINYLNPFNPFNKYK